MSVIMVIVAFNNYSIDSPNFCQATVVILVANPSRFRTPASGPFPEPVLTVLYHWVAATGIYKHGIWKYKRSKTKGIKFCHDSKSKHSRKNIVFMRTFGTMNLFFQSDVQKATFF